MAAKKNKDAPPAAPSFEDAIEELDELTDRLAHEPESLGKLIDDFERGQELIKYCHEALKSARQRIEVIQAGLQKDTTEQDLTDDTPPSSDDNDDVRLF